MDPKLTAFFGYKMKDIAGNIRDFETFRGAKCFLIINVACMCGLTKSNYQ